MSRVALALALVLVGCGETTAPPSTCDAARCDGCCNGATCVRLDAQSSDACGLPGAECTSCATELSCQQGLCVPADVCLTNNGDCDVNATCAAPPATTRCQCKSGFVGDGTTCAPVLSELSVTPGYLSPVFRVDLRNYLVVVQASTMSVVLTAATSTPGAEVTVDGLSSPRTVMLSSASTTVHVTARLAAAVSDDYQVTIVRSATSLAQAAYVKPSNTRAHVGFGSALALSADGTTLVVGSADEPSNATGIDGIQNDTSAPSAGAVYVFRRVSPNGPWAQEAYLKASNTGGGDDFGWAVAVSDDGNTIAVGAPGEDSDARSIGGTQSSNASDDSGAVYVFRRSTSWAQEAYVKSSNADARDALGWSVSLSADGDTLVAGAPFEDGPTNTTESSGAAYVFSRSGAAWSEQQVLRAATPVRNQLFGRVVSVSGDGATTAVAAPSEAMGGVVTVFRGPPTWSSDAVLRGDNTSEGDRFGAALSLSRDGQVLAVGAPNESTLGIGTMVSMKNADARASGAAYVFERHTTWAQAAFIKATNTSEGDLFGGSLALSADGATLACGALGEDSDARGVEGNQADDSAQGSGAVFLYRFSSAAWSRHAYVKPSNTSVGGAFGGAVALSSNGKRLAAAQLGDDSSAVGIDGVVDVAATDSGAAFVFDE